MIVLVSILGYVLILYLSCKKYLELLPIIITSSLISILYFCGLFGNLYLGSKLLFWIGITFFIYSSILLFFRKKLLLNVIASPGIVLFCLLFILVCIKFQAARYINFDEFTHWGLIDKAMVYQNSFPGKILGSFNYPIGINVFHYFFAINCSNNFESCSYFANLMLILSAFVILFYKLKWKDFVKILIILLLGFYALNKWGIRFRTIHADSVLSLFFGASILLYFYVVNKNIKKIFFLCPIIFTLPLLRQTGLIFALFVFLIILSGELVKVKLHRGNPIKLACYMLLILITIGLSQYSWNFRVKEMKTNNRYFGKGKFEDFFHISRPKEFDDMKNVALNFLKKSYQSSPFKFFAITILFLFPFVNSSNKYSKYKILMVYSLMILFWVIYWSGLLYVYLCKMDLPEALQISSYGRYSGTFLSAFLIVGIGLSARVKNIYKKTSAFRRPNHSIIFFVLTIMLIYMLFNTPFDIYSFVKNPINRGGYYSKRIEVADKIEFLKKILKRDQSVYFSLPQTEHSLYYIIKYELYPFYSQGNVIIIKGEREKISAFYLVKDFTAEQLMARLRIFDYFLALEKNKDFWEKYDKLFTPMREDDYYRYDVYEIKKTKSKVKLIPLY